MMRKYVAPIFVTATGAVVLHLTLGWMWTLIGAVIAGVWSGRSLQGGVIGLGGLGIGWGLLLLHSFVVAGGATAVLVRTLGQFMGNTPGEIVVGAMVIIGVILGGLGGLLGAQIRHAFWPRTINVE